MIHLTLRRSAALLSFAFLVGCQTLHAETALRGENDLFVQDGQLFKGEDTYELTAIAVPDLAARGAELPVMVPALARIAEHGGNAVCFDLTGFSEDGGKLDLEALRVVQAYAERTKDQRMRVIVRVLGDSTDADFRAKAVRAAARMLKREPRVLYLIDGPDAGELAAKFKRAAPALCVAAPENGDVLLVDEAPAELVPGTVYLVRGMLPDVTPSMHMLLRGADADYAALEAARVTAAETFAYEPDMSLLTDAERAEGFVPLFNGKDLNNWWVFGDNLNGFQVTDYGFIEWVEEGASALMSAKRYGDFVLRLEYKILTGGNSGVFLRAPRAARQSKIGMEFQIHGDHGGEPSDDSTGAIYLVAPATANSSLPNGQWNALEIVLRGPQLSATLNGVEIQNLNLDENEELKYRLRRGFIGLQDHSDYVAWRNVRIKEL
jgi:hypothetical protein